MKNPISRERFVRAVRIVSVNKEKSQNIRRMIGGKMKTKLICAMALACAAFQLAAMPTEEDVRRAEPVVKAKLASERAAFESGKKTRSEVAAAAMKLADEADSDAAKLLLMKGAFVLYVKDGNLEKAVETMNALESAISDMPPQSITNMIEAALLGVREKEAGARLYKLLDETKADIPSSIDLPSHIESKAIAASVKERSSVASILKGMIKLPGHDCWLSATELTQGQWESVMGYNPSSHKGANLPVDNVSRDDCDVFLEMLNKTKEVQASRFEFTIPSRMEWQMAASAGGSYWFKPGVAGDILDMAWLKENSSNQTHAVATKSANAFGFYDMQGNVSEWFLTESEHGERKGSSFYESAGEGCVKDVSWWWFGIPRNRRNNHYGLRLAAHIRSKSSSDGQRSPGSSGAESAQQQAVVDGYTWSYRVKNGEATIVTTNGLCAVSPSPKGDVSIPSTLGGTKVTSIGNHAFRNCRGLTSVTIPADVTSIGNGAFDGCRELKSVTIPYRVRNIGEWAFANCYALKSVTIPSNLERIGFGAFIHCRGLTSVTIPAKVVSIGGVAFGYCSALRQIKVDAANQSFTSIDGVLYTKDQSVLHSFPNALTSVKIPKGVTNIGGWAFEGCNGLKSVTIPEGVTTIENNAFKECGGLESVVMLSGVKKIGEQAFYNCRSLRSMTISEGVCDIGVSAFEGCGELTSLTLPQGLTKIGGNAFGWCGKLTSLTLPQGLTKIDRDAFRGMGKLTSVTIPESVTSIGKGVFSYCGGLTQINVAVGNQKYTSADGVLYTKDMTELVMCPNGLKEVTIPESVTNIGHGAFIGCSKLTSVMLPSGVARIGEWAFEGCNGLTSVTIPERVTKIDQCAFYSCGELTSLTMRGERPDAPNNIFERCGKLKSIHVPANAKSWEGMKDWCGIPLVKPAVQNRLGGLARLRQRRMEAKQQEDADRKREADAAAKAEQAEREAREQKERQRLAEERAQQREALLQIQEQLRKQREEREEARRWGRSHYMIVDLDKSGKDSVSYLDDVPKGGWSDEYRTKKMAFRRISPGSFEYMPGKSFKITKPFYIGVFEVTQKQYEMMMNGNPSEFKGDMRPVEKVSYIDIRGANKGLNWPKDNAVDNDSYLGKLRKRIGLEFDLPTEVQWEYACRAGTKGDFNVDGVEMVRLGKCAKNGGRNDKHVKVGSFLPNAWGLYDMHGNVWEWCVDHGSDAVGFMDWTAEAKEIATAPKGTEKWSLRIHRGGDWRDDAHRCRSSQRYSNYIGRRSNNLGFRLACPAEANDSKDPVSNGEYKFSYKLENGKAIITGIDPKPVGTVVIPDKIDGHLVTRIEGYNDRSPFWGCDQMTRVVLPAGLELGSFDSGVFISCKSLSSIEVSESNKELASLDGVLYSKDFSTLCVYPKTRESIKLSAKTKKVKVCAFRGCALKTAKIPEGVEVIDHWNFAECPNLVSVEFPESVTELGCSSFGVSDNMKKIVFNGDAPRTRSSWGQTLFSFAPSNLVVEVRKGTKGWKAPNFTELPERWPVGQRESRPIRYIGEAKKVGAESDTLKAGTHKHLEIAEGKKAYGGYTWSYRVRNGEATLVAEKDGKYSCAASPAPTGDVSIPPTLNGVKVTSIGREAFENCPGLKSVTIPEGVKVIDWKAFRNCKELTSVTFPEGLTHIGYSVFVDCHGLKSVTLPSSLKVVGWGAFVRCVGLTSVTIPEGVTSIGNDAFNGCSGLKSVVIPDSVTSIGTRAFIGCRELPSVTIPAKVASIGEGAFGGCSKLKKINLAAGNQAFTLVDGVLYTKDLSVLLACPGTMTDVTIPSSVTKIGDFAFRGCIGLESMTIPEGVTNIGWGAFEECDGLRSVTIPESVTDIAGSAFKSCRNLTSVTMRCERPDASDDIFQDCGKLKSIRVPANAKSWSGRKEWRGIPLVFDAK